jgi:phosphatidate phosphatase APP1
MGSVQYIRRVIRLLARPAHRRIADLPVVIRTYRGFGSHREVCVFGRVLRQSAFSRSFKRGGLPGELANLWRRMWRRGLGHAAIEARFGRARRRSRTDRYGFFFIRLPIEDLPDSGRMWHRVELEIAGAPATRVETEVFIAPRTAGYGVISDIDDTVVYTGVANKIKMLWRLFFSRAQSRVAFPGAGVFYRALHRGATGGQHNPMLYVSRGPWSIYGVLDTFFNLHDIPVGPILYLRYWGMTIDHPLPRRARDHKLALIRQALDLYANLPFILIGDSGQKDPEIYARIVREHPGRILAIYIRDVGPAPGRRRSIALLAKETARTGTELLLAADSHTMAEHAARSGYIPAGATAEILAACRADDDRTPYKGVGKCSGRTGMWP